MLCFEFRPWIAELRARKDYYSTVEIKSDSCDYFEEPWMLAFSYWRDVNFLEIEGPSEKLQNTKMQITKNPDSYQDQSKNSKFQGFAKSFWNLDLGIYLSF